MNDTLRFNISSSLFGFDDDCCMVAFDLFDASLLDDEALVRVRKEE